MLLSGSKLMRGNRMFLLGCVTSQLPRSSLPVSCSDRWGCRGESITQQSLLRERSPPHMKTSVGLEPNRCRLETHYSFALPSTRVIA